MKNSCIRDRKITEPLIVAITHDKDLSDRYLWRRRLQWGKRNTTEPSRDTKYRR